MAPWADIFSCGSNSIHDLVYMSVWCLYSVFAMILHGYHNSCTNRACFYNPSSSTTHLNPWVLVLPQLLQLIQSLHQFAETDPSPAYPWLGGNSDNGVRGVSCFPRLWCVIVIIRKQGSVLPASLHLHISKLPLILLCRPGPCSGEVWCRVTRDTWLGTVW